MDGETSILGWRLVRPLSDEPGRRRYVAVAEMDGQEAGSRHWHGFERAPSPAQTERALVVVATGEEAESLIRECEIRERIGSEFVARARECGQIAHERSAAVFPLESTTSLARLLTGPELDAGAAVTLVVPLVEAVNRAHTSGYAHGSLSISVCEVDGRGCPRVDGWGGAKDLSGISLARADLVRGEDLRALARIVHAVLARVPVPAPEGVSGILARMEERRAPKGAADDLIDELFEWAPPAPVGLLPAETARPPVEVNDPNGSGLIVRPPAGGVRDGGSDDDPLIGAPTTRRRGSGPSRDRPILSVLRRSVPSRLVSTTDALARWSAAVRARLWLAVAAVGVVTALAGSLLGAAPLLSRAADANGSTDAQEGTTADTAPREDPVDGVGGGGVPAATRSGVGTDPTGPIDLGGLLAERDRCLLARDIECVTGLYAPSAPGLEGDLSESEGGPRLAAGCGPWQVTAELGDVRVFVTGCAQLASVSVQHGDGGWRLRELRWAP